MCNVAVTYSIQLIVDFLMLRPTLWKKLCIYTTERAP